jgi:enoyl-CoA hydratase/carnithine racemase
MSDRGELTDPGAARAGRTEPTVPVVPPVAMRIADGIACVELNRPSRGNALSAMLVESLLEALARAVADPAVHTLMLAGAGRHFCTGFDLGDLDAASDGDLLLRVVRIETLLDAVWRAPVRTVAVATGRAWGAGADLVAACDLRLVTPEATLRFPGAAFGLVLGTRRLAERVGADQARQWIAEGSTIDATAATAAGLASRIVTPPADDPGADALARWGHEAFGAAPVIDRETLAAIRAASRPAGGPGADALADADLAALVRSAARPGLKARILAYRERARSPAEPRPG